MIQAFGGCNADPDAWDVYNDFLAYGTGPCVLIQNLSTFKTVSFASLNHGIVTCVRFDSKGILIIGTSQGDLFLLDPATTRVSSVLNFESSITHCSIYNNDILISTAVDGIRYITRNYENPDEGLILQQKLFPDLRCVSLALTRFHDVLLFGLGHPDGTVQLYVYSTGSSVTLEGYAWSLSTQFCQIDENSILFASASQDRTIRLWRISLDIASEISKLNVAVTSHATLNTEKTPFHVELFSNLEGHSDWVNAISFCNGPSKSLCSASFDGQVLIWTSSFNQVEPNAKTAIYADYDISLRLGTTNVADDQSGFIGCKLFKDNDVIALSRNGGFSRWIDGKTVRCFTGHYDGVTGLSWTTIGCFISVGLDNTGRVFGIDNGTYRELARPLIHGHAVFDVCELTDDLYAFVSDEKNVRVLQPSQCFFHIHQVPQLENKHLPFASMVSPLSLDNTTIPNADDVKAMFDPITASDFMKDRIPTSHEMWLTRWPEFKSIFGHEREIRQMTVAENGDWFATGDDRGGYVIYDKVKLERRCNYMRDLSKALTTAIEASPDGSMLVQVLISGLIKLIDPVTCTILKEINAENNSYACGWSTNSQYFAIGGESGINVYEREGELAATFNDAGFVTALQFVDEYSMIFGKDDGQILQVKYDASERSFMETHKYQSHGMRVSDIRINHDLKQFISGAMDHVVLLQQLYID
ncbi:Elongator subunit elp2 [Tritrichomonas musculus]|uniref:Elongator complex protein 2 n=1 Tax=Tritrichomonas musculus TaxID=1915356 RepID=A0ABR2K0J1_9EUKA